LDRVKFDNLELNAKVAELSVKVAALERKNEETLESINAGQSTTQNRDRSPVVEEGGQFHFLIYITGAYAYLDVIFLCMCNFGRCLDRNCAKECRGPKKIAHIYVVPKLLFCPYLSFQSVSRDLLETPLLLKSNWLTPTDTLRQDETTKGVIPGTVHHQRR